MELFVKCFAELSTQELHDIRQDRRQRRLRSAEQDSGQAAHRENLRYLPKNRVSKSVST